MIILFKFREEQDGQSSDELAGRQARAIACLYTHTHVPCMNMHACDRGIMSSTGSPADTGLVPSIESLTP